MEKRDFPKLLSRITTNSLSITESEITLIIKKVLPILKNEPKVLKLKEPITIVGSLYGNFRDLQKITKIVGSPKNIKYLFLGNYVSKGKNSLKILLYLLISKILYPNFIYFLRGGHESCTLNHIFGFYEEIIKIYKNDHVYKEIIKIYEYLPICCILKKSKSFCISGGLSPDIKFVKEIKSLKNSKEILNESILADLLWAIPQEDLVKENFDFAENGLGYYFPYNFTKEFLKNNKLLRIIRSKDFYKEGIRYFHNGLVVSVFSCSEYGLFRGGKVGFLIVNERGEVRDWFFEGREEGVEERIKEINDIFI